MLNLRPRPPAKTLVNDIYHCHRGPKNNTTPDAIAKAAKKKKLRKGGVAEGKSIKVGCKAHFIVKVNHRRGLRGG